MVLSIIIACKAYGKPRNNRTPEGSGDSPPQEETRIRLPATAPREEQTYRVRPRPSAPAITREYTSINTVPDSEKPPSYDEAVRMTRVESEDQT